MFKLLFLAAITVVFYLLQLAMTNLLVSAIEEEEENPGSLTAATHKTIATIIAWATLLGIVLFNKFLMGNVKAQQQGTGGLLLCV